MALYRLDYCDARGGAVPDALFGGAWIARRLDRARSHAVQVAACTPTAKGGQRPVMVTKIGNSGSLTPAIIAHPSGVVTRATPEAILTAKVGGRKGTVEL